MKSVIPVILPPIKHIVYPVILPILTDYKNTNPTNPTKPTNPTNPTNPTTHT